MLAYRAALGIASAPPYLDGEALKAVGEFQGSYLVAFSSHLASRPSRVTESMLRCDLALLHHMRVGNQLAPRQVQAVLSSPSAVVQQAELVETPPPTDPGKVSRPRTRNVGGVHVDDRAVNPNPQGNIEDKRRRAAPRGLLTPQLFRQFVEDNLEVDLDGKGQS